MFFFCIFVVLSGKVVVEEVIKIVIVFMFVVIFCVVIVIIGVGVFFDL